MTEWIEAKIKKIKIWTVHLFSIILEAPILPFYAGQFAKLRIKHKKKYINRVYSYVNEPKDKKLEFCIRLIPKGKMTNQLYHLLPGDSVLITKQSNGFFTMFEIPKCKHLWMIATGTAIGPFCSILQDESELYKIKKIIILYAVSYVTELIYLPLIKKIKKKYKNRIIIQTIISREKHNKSITGRIPILLKNKKIEEKIKYFINPNETHIMLCGNPTMVKDTQHFLIKYKKLKKHFRREPGNISIENYW